MLTVPVLIKGRFNQKIYDVMIDISQKFEKKHFNSIYSNYKKSKYFELFIEDLEDIYNSNINKLVDLNIRLIEWLSAKLGIDTKFVFSSELASQGSKTELLIDICNKLNGHHYLSPSGSKEYIDENNFKQSGITLSYQNFVHPTYNQLYGDFIPYMSAIDFVFNEGRKSLEEII